MAGSPRPIAAWSRSFSCSAAAASSRATRCCCRTASIAPSSRPSRRATHGAATRPASSTCRTERSECWRRWRCAQATPAVRSRASEGSMRMVDRRTRPSAHLWRALLVVASCAAMLAAWRAQAQGTDWQPTRPIEIVVPSAPGGGLDITGRTLQRLVQEGKYADYPATVVNKAGGSGTIGIAYINQHKADGHYICVQSPALLTNGITG